jgi:hypothetical protein
MCLNIFKKKIELPAIKGCIPSPLDKRDILLSAVQAPIPLNQLPESFIIPYKLTVLNQNGYPACVGFSAASLKAEKERREQKLIDFDGLWLYNKCKELEGNNLPGTYLRLAMKVLKDIGAKPLNELETEASKYKIGAYAKVDDVTFDGIKSAIYQNGVLISGFYGSDQGWQNAYIRPPKFGEEIWGHAIALIGFLKDYIVGQNSWGIGWGDQGLFFIPKTYIESSNFMEAWASLVDLPDDFVTIEKPIHAFTINMKQGDKNKEVVWLQKCLKYLGVFPLVIDCTGFYGQITVQAVRLFQTSYGLTQTGAINATDRVKLNSVFF